MAKDRDWVIKQVQAAWRIADDTRAPEGEREAARNKARDLMARYQIDEVILQEKQGKREQIILRSIRLTRDGKNNLVKDQRLALAWVIARNNRCQAVIQYKSPTADVDTGKPVAGGEFMTLMGYVSDVDFVEGLYTALVLQMLEAMLEEPQQTTNYQANFAAGYVDRIDQRLLEIGRTVTKMAADEGSSMALVLVDRKTQVENAFQEMFPNLRKVQVAKHSYDPNAQERGRRKASTADIGQDRLGGGGQGELGK